MTSHNRRTLSYEHLIKKNEVKAGNASTDIVNGQEDESWSIFLQPYVSIMWHVIFDQINLLDLHYTSNTFMMVIMNPSKHNYNGKL